MELTISINLVQLIIVFNKHNEMIILEERYRSFQFNMFIPVKKVFSYNASIFNI